MIALAAELIDETDYHISFARQLLMKATASDTARQDSGTRILYYDT